MKDKDTVKELEFFDQKFKPLMARLNALNTKNVRFFETKFKVVIDELKRNLLVRIDLVRSLIFKHYLFSVSPCSPIH